MSQTPAPEEVPASNPRRTAAKPPREAQAPDAIRFFGSQVGGESVINYGYTDMPFKLLMLDIRYFFVFIWFLPWIIWPITPCDSGPFDELALTKANIWCIAVHTVLIFLQLGFICALPFSLLFPLWMVLLGIAGFFALNWAICRLLNGKDIKFDSDPKYASPDAHPTEQWVFLNGVAVGETWLMSNINRLALTFGRPVIGIHNQTRGILFDVIECLIQRNFGYATGDVREAYKIMKKKLYDAQYSKVVFILHSQGGIEGGLVLDWLLQELPQDLLAKLEVYTFGNAANHFNNPHVHLRAQKLQQQTPAPSTTATGIVDTISDVPMTDSPIEVRSPASIRRTDMAMTPSSSTMTNSAGGAVDSPTIVNGNHASDEGAPHVVPASDRVIGHIEHYAHTTDFVALWGVLHFVTNKMASQQLPRFIGRVFSRESHRGGHQFCQHYLDGMFPLEKGEDGEFRGCADSNEFMDSIVENCKPGEGEPNDMREDIANSFALLQNERVDDRGVEMHGGSFHGQEPASLRKRPVRVKDLSRLWLYRNGQSPPEIPRSSVIGPDGVVRGRTM